MSQHDLFPSMGQARHGVRELPARRTENGTGRSPSELTVVLGELRDVLGNQQIHCELLNEILTRSGDAVFAKDRDGRYVMINARGAHMLGKLVKDVLGRNDTALFAPDGAARIMAVDRMVLSTGRPSTFEETFDVQGLPTTLRGTASIWHGSVGGARGTLGTARDVTARSETEHGVDGSEDRLPSLAPQSMIAEEQLRRTLATDLHDGVGQDLALVKLMLRELRSRATADLPAEFSRIERLAEQADRSLRSITYKLSPSDPHDLGLVPALRWLSKDGDRRKRW